LNLTSRLSTTEQRHQSHTHLQHTRADRSQRSLLPCRLTQSQRKWLVIKTAFLHIEYILILEGAMNVIFGLRIYLSLYCQHIKFETNLLTFPKWQKP